MGNLPLFNFLFCCFIVFFATPAENNVWLLYINGWRQLSGLTFCRIILSDKVEKCVKFTWQRLS